MMRLPYLLAFLCVALFAAAPSFPEPLRPRTEPGYRGIWFTLGQKSEFGDKYSGGLGTYTAKHRPIAVYAAEADKTFFVYGGSRDGERYLLNMIGYLDHARNTVPRPVVVHDKGGVDDPHDNASLEIDTQGHLWVFVSGRGSKRPGFIYRSRNPYDISSFELVREDEMTYPQPLYAPGHGFFFFFTRYTAGRELYWSTSPDGRDWTNVQKLAGMGGHYQVTARMAMAKGQKVATAFNYHPKGNVDKRTNLYYLESHDWGATWSTAAGLPLEVPVTDTKSPAMVFDAEAENRLVYVKDLVFDAEGRPVALFVSSAGHAPGPAGDPRIWHTARYNGDAWDIRPITESTHNYDMGQLWIEGDTWRVVAPTAPGPQPLGAGGEIEIWSTTDHGQSWTRDRNLTEGSSVNHSYVRRPVNAHPDFFAFWADGNPDRHSASHLYFTNHDGSGVWRLPYTMGADEEHPQRIGETKEVAKPQEK